MVAAAATRHAVTESTQVKRNRLVGLFLSQMELTNVPFLTSIEDFECPSILAAIVEAYHHGRIPSLATHAPQASGSCHDALEAVEASFRADGRASPAHNSSHQLDSFLWAQLRGYANEDPAEQPQKALTLRILRELDDTDLDRAIHQLARGAFVFAMPTLALPWVSLEPTPSGPVQPWQCTWQA